MPESQQTSDYPGALDTWVTVDNKEDLVEESDINKIKAAIEAVQTEIGTDPAGTLATLKARLAIMMATSGALAQGTSFPVSPAPVEGQIFYRTDANETYVYDGSDWQLISISRTQVFHTSATMTVPTGYSAGLVFMCGAGAGGAGGHSSNADSGGGGGGGVSIIGHILKFTGGSDYAVVVGVGGSGGAGGSSPTNGANGGSSSIVGDDYTLTCAGGIGGTWATSDAGTGGNGGAGTTDTGAFAKSFLNATDGSKTPASYISFSGGDGANPQADGAGGAGGGSCFGKGGTGGDSTHGTDGGVGAGGGGGKGGNSSYFNGGDGGDGIVIVIF